MSEQPSSSSQSKTDSSTTESRDNERETSFWSSFVESPAKSLLSTITSSSSTTNEQQESTSLWNSLVDSSPAKTLFGGISLSKNETTNSEPKNESSTPISKAMNFIQQVVTQESPSMTSNEETDEVNLPWSGVTDPTKREEIRKRVLLLSKSKEIFLTSPPESVSFEFEMNKDVSKTATALLKMDTQLQRARYELVRPRRKKGVHVIEKEFWRNYFYQISLITDEFLDVDNEDDDESKSFQEEHFGRALHPPPTTTSDEFSKLTEELETTLNLNNDDLLLTQDDNNTGSPVLNATDLNAALELDLASEDFSISKENSMEDLKKELGIDDSEWELLNNS